MKPYSLLLGSALALTLVCGVNAEDNKPTTKEPEKRKAGPPPGAGRDVLVKLADELGLTPEQKEKYLAATKETGEQMRKLHEQKETMPKDELLKKALAYHKGLTAKMKEILTPEQFAKWEPIREANHKQVIERDKQREVEKKEANAKKTTENTPEKENNPEKKAP